VDRGGVICKKMVLQVLQCYKGGVTSAEGRKNEALEGVGFVTLKKGISVTKLQSSVTKLEGDLIVF
jgi:hypothetical protein